MITNCHKYFTIAQATFFVLLFNTSINVGHATDSLTNTQATTLSQSQALPNAYELLKKLEAQQIETARLAAEVEELQRQVNELSLQNNDPSKTNTYSTQATIDLRNQLLVEINPIIEAKIAEQLKMHPVLTQVQTTNRQSTRRPSLTQSEYNALAVQEADKIETQRVKSQSSILLTNTDLSNQRTPIEIGGPIGGLVDTNDANTNPLTVSTSDVDAQQAYINAYKALKDEGAKAGIEKMQEFIETYPNHKLVPNAHYWLGEFYLKDTPPKIANAKLEFLKVTNEFADYPSNENQSRALYRLATFAKSESKPNEANRYIERIITEYPESREAGLSKNLKW